MRNQPWTPLRHSRLLHFLLPKTSNISESGSPATWPMSDLLVMLCFDFVVFQSGRLMRGGLAGNGFLQYIADF